MIFDVIEFYNRTTGVRDVLSLNFAILFFYALYVYLYHWFSVQHVQEMEHVQDQLCVLKKFSRNSFFPPYFSE
jgi:hypothetical protein